MGFPQERSEAALKAIQNKSVDHAVDWYAFIHQACETSTKSLSPCTERYNTRNQFHNSVPGFYIVSAGFSCSGRFVFYIFVSDALKAVFFHPGQFSGLPEITGSHSPSPLYSIKFILHNNQSTLSVLSSSLLAS